MHGFTLQFVYELWVTGCTILHAVNPATHTLYHQWQRCTSDSELWASRLIINQHLLKSSPPEGYLFLHAPLKAAFILALASFLLPINTYISHLSLVQK